MKSCLDCGDEGNSELPGRECFVGSRSSSFTLYSPDPLCEDTLGMGGKVGGAEN